jgi:SAM-dependent methyltransferase
MFDRFTARIAEAYGSHSQKYTSILEPVLKPMGDEIVRMAKLKGEERILDVATGTGLIARTAAALSMARVTGVDISPGVLAKALQLSEGKISYIAGNALRLPFRKGCFDLVTCGLSLSHFVDSSIALREVHRVLRSKGQFITSAWGNEGDNPSKEAAVEVRKRFLELRQVTFEGKFSEEIWADVGSGCEALRQAGFVDVQVTTLNLSGKYRDTSSAVESAFAWPLTRYRIAKLDPMDQHRLAEETATAILEVNDLCWQSEIHIYQATPRE